MIIAKKKAPVNIEYKNVLQGPSYRKRLFLSFLSASFHLGAGYITLLVQEIEEAFLPLDAALRYFLGAASFFLASCHFCAGDIAFLIDIIEVTLLPLDAQLYQLLFHIFNSPPFRHSLFCYSTTVNRI